MAHCLKLYGFFLTLFISCNCSEPETTISPTPIPAKTYYNLERIDLGLQGSGNFSFEFNGQKLTKDGDLYISKDLIVYQAQDPTNKDKWYATVIGVRGISSKLKINTPQAEIIQEVDITTTNKVVEYKDEIGPEWPGMQNGRNVCFANSLYKVMARCTGFDKALSEDKSDGINIYLRNLINGIRLGKQSALHAPQVNVKVNDRFLDKVTELVNPEVFNDKKQHVSEDLLRAIMKLLYTQVPTNVETLIHEPKLENAFASIYKRSTTGELVYGKYSIYEINNNSYLTPDASSFIFDIKESSVNPNVKRPQFYIVVLPHGTMGGERTIPNSFIAPQYDPKTNKKNR